MPQMDQRFGDVSLMVWLLPLEVLCCNIKEIEFMLWTSEGTWESINGWTDYFAAMIYFLHGFHEEVLSGVEELSTLCTAATFEA